MSRLIEKLKEYDDYSFEETLQMWSDQGDKIYIYDITVVEGKSMRIATKGYNEWLEKLLETLKVKE